LIQNFAESSLLNLLSRSVVADDTGKFLRPLLLFCSMNLNVISEEKASLVLFSGLLLFHHMNYTTLSQESQIGGIIYQAAALLRTTSNLRTRLCKSLTCH